MWLYVRTFPQTSLWWGYGRVDDEPVAPAAEQSADAPPARMAPATQGNLRVTLYTALSCPFCPIVEKRLEALRKEWGSSWRRST
jgi:hypothetical protein